MGLICLFLVLPVDELHHIAKFHETVSGSRQAIMTMQADIEVYQAIWAEEKQALLPVELDSEGANRFRVWKDHDNLRVDYSRPGVLADELAFQVAPDARLKRVSRRIVFAGEQFIEAVVPVPGAGVAVAPRAGDVNADEAIKLRWFDPCQLGLLPVSSGFWYSSSMESLVPVSTSHILEEAPIELNGCLNLYFRIQRDDGVVLEYFLDPGKANAVSASSLTRTVGETIFKQRISSDLHLTDGIWFPERVHLQATKNGALLSEEVWRVLDVKFNEAIDANVFSLAGLEIDENLPISTPSGVKNHKEGVLMEPTLIAEPLHLEQPQPQSTYRRLGAVLVLLGVGLIAWAFRNRARGPN